MGVLPEAKQCGAEHLEDFENCCTSMEELFPISSDAVPEEEKCRHEVLATYSNCISRGPMDLGTADGMKHTIDTGSAQPIQVPPCRVPFHKGEERRRQVHEMLEAEIIEPSESSWSSPVVLVAKPDGTQHFCVDYCALNLVTKRDYGMSKDPEKVRIINEWPVPANATQLKAFLGTADYYRQFIPYYAQIACPLYRAEQKGDNLTWTAECEEAFWKIKRHLSNAPILAFPQLDVPFILDTDASDCGLGAVLSQVQDGQERVIAYAARALSKAERNYSTTRKERLALVWGSEHFETYLYGRRFLARTDHNALCWLRNFKSPRGQVARWLERLSDFDFDVQHRSGRLHNNADGLSHFPWDEQGAMLREVESEVA